MKRVASASKQRMRLVGAHARYISRNRRLDPDADQAGEVVSGDEHAIESLRSAPQRLVEMLARVDVEPIERAVQRPIERFHVGEPFPGPQLEELPEAVIVGEAL